MTADPVYLQLARQLKADVDSGHGIDLDDAFTLQDALQKRRAQLAAKLEQLVMGDDWEPPEC